MSKARKIYSVDVSVHSDGFVWVTVGWKGDHRRDGEFTHKSYLAAPWEDARRASILKRARQMQGLLMGSWYKKRVVATGDKNGFTAVSPDYEEDNYILSGQGGMNTETADYEATIASLEAGTGRV